VEIDLRPRCDDGTVPDDCILHQWYNTLEEATKRIGKSILLPPNMKETLQIMGFVDIREEVIKLPLNQWSSDPEAQAMALWYNPCFTDCLEPLSLKPFTRSFQWVPDQVSPYLEEVKKASRDTSLHAYNNM